MTDGVGDNAAGSISSPFDPTSCGDTPSPCAVIAAPCGPIVAEQAHARVDHADLTAMLYFQGYRADEFVTD